MALGVQKKSKRKNRRIISSIVSYLKSDDYLFAPLFSNFPPLESRIQTNPPSNSESSKVDDVSVAGFEALGIKRVNKKKGKRMSEKVNEYLKSDSHMYGPIISPKKLGSSLKGKLKTTNLATMKVSTSTTTIREDNNSYKNLRSDISEQTLLNGRINSPKRSLRSRLSRETDLSPAFSSLPAGKDGEARSK